MKLTSIHALFGHLDQIDPDHVLPIYAIISKNDSELQLAQKSFRGLCTSKLELKSIHTSDTQSLSSLNQELSSFNLFGKKTLFFIHEIEKLKPQKAKLLLQDILDQPNHFFVVFSSKPLPKAELATIEKKGLILDIPPVKPWEKDQATGQFIALEAKRFNVEISPSLNPLLITLYGHNPMILSTEIEKLSIYSQRTRPITKDVVLSLSPQKRQPDLFLLINALFEKKAPSIIWKLYTALTEFSPISLIRLIRSRASLYSDIKSHIQHSTSSSLSEHFPQINNHRLKTIQQHLKSWNSWQLQRIVCECDTTEQKLKTFSISDKILVEMLLSTVIDPDVINTHPLV